MSTPPHALNAGRRANQQENIIMLSKGLRPSTDPCNILCASMCHSSKASHTPKKTVCQQRHASRGTRTETTAGHADVGPHCTGENSWGTQDVQVAHTYDPHNFPIASPPSLLCTASSLSTQSTRPCPSPPRHASLWSSQDHVRLARCMHTAVLSGTTRYLMHRRVPMSVMV